MEVKVKLMEVDAVMNKAPIYQPCKQASLLIIDSPVWCPRRPQCELRDVASQFGIQFLCS